MNLRDGGYKGGSGGKKGNGEIVLAKKIAHEHTKHIQNNKTNIQNFSHNYSGSPFSNSKGDGAGSSGLENS